MPAMGDPRFARAVIYMCAHSADGAMGIMGNGTFSHMMSYSEQDWVRIREQIQSTNAADKVPESIQMARMIHRIHSGEELTQPYTIYGYGGTPYDFTEVLYPGDRRNCAACHTSAATANLPMATGTLNVITQKDYFTPQGPGTAACLGCHDTRDAAAHAYLNTAVFGEACGACHGTNSEWSVAVTHAR